MLKRILLALLLLAGTAQAKPYIQNSGEPPSNSAAGYEVPIIFAINDTTASDAVVVRNTCTLRADIAGSDVVQVWAVPKTSTTATSGTLLATFSASTSSSPVTFQAGTRYVKFIATTAATGGSIVYLTCGNSPMSSSGGGVPGLVGDTGNDETLNFLYGLRGFRAVSEQLTTIVYVDPYYGNDLTGDGSYTAPYFSFAKIKTTCLTVPHSKCVVKGRNRWFTHTLLTLSYTAAAGTRPLQIGETVTFATPAGTAEVLWAEGNIAAVSWLSGADPRVNGATTFTAGGGESQGSVTAVRDSLNGFPARVIAPTDITVATDVIAGTAGTGHSYANQAGPFKWYNQTTLPTTTGSTLVEYSTDVYICNVVAGVSFQVSTSPTCASTIDFTSQGTGSNQIIAGGDGSGLRKSIDVSCTDNSRLCVLFTSEYVESPWGIDSGKLAGDGALYNEANILRWPDGNIGAGPGTYNTPTGGLFIALPVVGDPTTHGWIGVENGIVQNLADDCFFSSAGGKMVAIRVRCNIVNGTGDRSQNGTNPKYQSHSSIVSSSGVNSVNATAAAGSMILINADGSTTQMGSDSGSGGFLNPNNFGVLRFFSPGVVKADGVPGATDCSAPSTPNVPCNSPFVVNPGGDAVVIGPNVLLGGNSFFNTLTASTGGALRLILAKMAIDFRGTSPAASSITNDPTIFNIAGGVQNTTKTILGYNLSFRANGPRNFLTLCPLQGTTAATANSRLNMILDNIVMEWVGTAASFRTNVTDCGTAGYTDADAVARASVKLRGVWDADDDNAGCGGGACFFYDINSRAIGSCGSANTFLNDVCTAVDSAGNATPSGAWEWFTTKSADSGGAGVDGLQWATTDPQLRCSGSTKECWDNTTAVSSPTYTIPLTDYYTGTDIGCLPADVLGTKVCNLTLKSVHAGAR